MAIEYIEREAAKEAARRAEIDANYDGRKYDAECVVDALDFTPVADVKLVVHGEWLVTNDRNKLRCSNCDVIHLIAQYPHGNINYCPNCGADMRGCEDEEK